MNPSPFTAALVRHIATPDVDVGVMFTAVRRDVMRATSNRQHFEALSSLSQPLYLVKSGKAPIADGVLLGPDDSPESISLSPDAEFWLLIRDTDKARNFETYVQQFPQGRFAALAKRKLDQLTKPERQPLIKPQLPAIDDAAYPKARYGRADAVAVIVGNSVYRDVPNVDHAGRDAEAMKLLAVKTLGLDSANIIVLRDATARQWSRCSGRTRITRRSCGG